MRRVNEASVALVLQRHKHKPIVLSRLCFRLIADYYSLRGAWLFTKYLQIQSYWLLDEGKQGEMFTARGAPGWGSVSANMWITYHSSNILIILINRGFLPSQEIQCIYICRPRCRRSYKYNKSVKKTSQMTILRLNHRTFFQLQWFRQHQKCQTDVDGCQSRVNVANYTNVADILDLDHIDVHI